MKALHIISGGDSGGAKTHVFTLLEALKKIIDVRIICLTPGIFYKDIQTKEIDNLLIEQRNRFDLSVVKKIATIIDEGKYDVLHVHGARSNFIAFALKRHISIPVITTMHSDYKMDFTVSLYKRLVYTALNKGALRFINYFIAVSESFKDMLIERRFKPNKIFTVYNGMNYNTPLSYISREEFAAKYNLDPGKRYIGIIGRFDKVKGHDVFIKACGIIAGKIPDVHFLLAGEGPERNNLAAAAERLNISDRVHFLGFIKEIYGFLNFIDINTLTSLSESFPYVLLEGARLKKPTVSSAVGGIPDLIEDGECGFLFESRDAEQLAKKVIWLLNNPDLAKGMGEALYEKATTHFSGENMARRHVEIYQGVIKDFYDKKRYDVVMSGYYGFNNSGDDALLSAIIENLRRYESGVRILTLSKRPLDTMKSFRIDAVKRSNPFEIHKALKTSKLFLNGGGTLIHDATSSRSLWYYLGLILWAKKYKLKIVLYANGYGPFKPQNEKIAAHVTEKADLITLRDDLSYKELRRIGVKNDTACVTADPAITLNPAEDNEIIKIFEKEGIDPGKEYIAVSVRSWPKADPRFEEKIACIADYIYERCGYTTIFTPMKFDDDYQISKNIMSKMKSGSHLIAAEYGAEQMMGIISKCRFMLGMRLHSLIYATAVSVPVIGIVYDPKVKGFLRYVNQDIMTDACDISIERLKDAVNLMADNGDAIKAELERHTDILKEKALENAKMTIQLLRDM